MALGVVLAAQVFISPPLQKLKCMLVLGDGTSRDRPLTGSVNHHIVEKTVNNKQS